MVRFRAPLQQPCATASARMSLVAAMVIHLTRQPVQAVECPARFNCTAQRLDNLPGQTGAGSDAGAGRHSCCETLSRSLYHRAAQRRPPFRSRSMAPVTGIASLMTFRRTTVRRRITASSITSRLYLVVAAVRRCRRGQRSPSRSRGGRCKRRSPPGCRHNAADHKCQPKAQRGRHYRLQLGRKASRHRPFRRRQRGRIGVPAVARSLTSTRRVIARKSRFSEVYSSSGYP